MKLVLLICGHVSSRQMENLSGPSKNFHERSGLDNSPYLAVDALLLLGAASSPVDHATDCSDNDDGAQSCCFEQGSQLFGFDTVPVGLPPDTEKCAACEERVKYSVISCTRSSGAIIVLLQEWESVTRLI